MLNQVKNKIPLAALVIPASATDSIRLNPEANSGFSTLSSLSIPGIISGAISLVLIVVAVVFFFILVFGGLKWITSGGDEKKVAAARAQITNALIGLAIVFSAWAIMNLLGTIFGFNLTKEGFKIPTFNSPPAVISPSPTVTPTPTPNIIYNCYPLNATKCDNDNLLSCLDNNKVTYDWTLSETCPNGCNNGICN